MWKTTGTGKWVCENTGGSQCIHRITMGCQESIGVFSDFYRRHFGDQDVHQKHANLCAVCANSWWPAHVCHFASWHHMNVFCGFRWIYPWFQSFVFLAYSPSASVLTNELTEESDQFRFLRVVCFTNLRSVVGLILVKASVMRISIPLDLSSRSFIPLPRFIRSSHTTPLLAPSQVLFPPCSAEAAHAECLF